MTDIDETIAYVQNTLDAGGAWVHRAHVEALLAEIERLRAQVAVAQEEVPPTRHTKSRKAQATE